MSNVVYRKFDDDMPRVVRGHGWHLETADGEVILDLSGGPGVACLGYSNEFVLETLKKQMGKISYAFSGSWSTNPPEIAANIIQGQFNSMKPGWFGAVSFHGSGSEAVDLSCKLAAQYAAERGEDRDLFAALEYAYHGVTLLPHSLTGDIGRYGLLGKYHGKTRASHVLRIRSPYDCSPGVALENTRQVFQRCHNRVAAVIVEPVVSSLGCWALPSDYLQELRTLCDEAGCLLIFDEVFCGSGRCGAFSCSDLVDVWPDIVILSKSLVGGYQPVSAICISKKVTDIIRDGSGGPMWGTTYGAHALGCTAVAAVQRYVIDHGLVGRVKREGPSFAAVVKNCLVNTCGGIVRNLNAQGFFIGFEFVDPKTNKPFPEALGFHSRVRRAAFARGVSLYTRGGTVKGKGDFGILAPAFEMDVKTFSDGVTLLAEAVRAAYAELQKGT